MASSSIKQEDEKIEYFDSEEVLERKIAKLAKYVAKSRCFIGFTGAGISTSCGIPDFRSGYNTVLETGPGAWEVLSERKPVKKSKVVEITEAIPSKTHMAFAKLIDERIMKHVVSQNVDGLHRKSGISSENISELHGNIYIEKCIKCHKEYLRDVDVVTSNCATDHNTGNRCENQSCKGVLIDNIINFGEHLDQAVLTKAFYFSSKADLCLAMGSSLRVTPASSIAKRVAKNKQRLVIVNLQKTPLDKYAKFVIHAFCDVVMEKLMEKLELQIPQFRLVRFIKINHQSGMLTVNDIESDESSFSFLKSVRFYHGESSQSIRKSPFELKLMDDMDNLAIKLRFHGHYGEPTLKIKVPNNVGTEILRLEYNPYSGVWAVEQANRY